MHPTVQHHTHTKVFVFHTIFSQGSPHQLYHNTLTFHGIIFSNEYKYIVSLGTNLLRHIFNFVFIPPFHLLVLSWKPDFSHRCGCNIHTFGCGIKLCVGQCYTRCFVYTYQACRSSGVTQVVVHSCGAYTCSSGSYNHDYVTSISFWCLFWLKTATFFKLFCSHVWWQCHFSARDHQQRC